MLVKRHSNGNAELKKELHQYIDESDGLHIKMIYALVKDYREEDNILQMKTPENLMTEEKSD